MCGTGFFYAKKSILIYLNPITMKKIVCVLFLILCFSGKAQQKSEALTQKEILLLMDKHAADLLKEAKANSVSIGVVKEGKTYTKHYGEIDKGKGNTATNTTTFEVASITKLFTGLLAAQAVLEKKINLDDDIRKYITGDYPNLEYQGSPIRFRDLLSFRTGFSNDLPDNSEIRKNINDTSYLAFKKLDDSYNRATFFQDLHAMKLDTLPGKKFKYSNGSVQLTAHILENVYHKNYETLLKENFFDKLALKDTQLHLSPNTIIANGYNSKNILMPNLSDNLWGAAGGIKSTLRDLVKFLAFELDTKNKLAVESQRNLLDSETMWNGYFWDGIEVSGFGKNSWKHGGAFGTQNMFLVYPESKLGISVIVNVSDQNTSNAIGHAAAKLALALLPREESQQGIYGYKIKDNSVQFTYVYNTLFNSDLVKSVSVAGSFNNWNTEDKNYQMIRKNKNTFELSIPVSNFKKDQLHTFKFVINKTGWVEAPKNISNKENSGDENLILNLY